MANKTIKIAGDYLYIIDSLTPLEELKAKQNILPSSTLVEEDIRMLFSGKTQDISIDATEFKTG